MPKLTKRYVEAIKPGASDIVEWDTETRGFGVRVKPSGVRSYMVQYRNQQGQSRRLTLGQHGPITCEGARKLAVQTLGAVAKGEDPVEDRKNARTRGMTVAELCDLYLAEGCGGKKASTLDTDRGRIQRHIKPLLGKKLVKDLVRADLERFQRDVTTGKTATDEKTGFRGRAIVTGGKGTATRTMGLLGGILRFAVDRGILDEHPGAGIKRAKDGKSERFLSPSELARLGDTLATAEAEGTNRYAIAAIRMLLLTGARKGEVLGLRWEWVDFDWSCLRLPDSKTGAKVVPVGAPVLELLAGLPRVEGNPYVFPGEVPGASFIGLPKAWERIRARATLAMWRSAEGTAAGRLVAELEGKLGRAATFDEVVTEAKTSKVELPVGLMDVRLHDLRHSFASVAAASGDGLLIIGKMLGHSDVKTTARYAHLTDSPVKAAADRTAGRIAAALVPAARGAEIVELPKHPRRRA